MQSWKDKREEENNNNSSNNNIDHIHRSSYWLHNTFIQILCRQYICSSTYGYYKPWKIQITKGGNPVKVCLIIFHIVVGLHHPTRFQYLSWEFLQAWYTVHWADRGHITSAQLATLEILDKGSIQENRETENGWSTEKLENFEICHV